MWGMGKLNSARIPSAIPVPYPTVFETGWAAVCRKTTHRQLQTRRLFPHFAVAWLFRISELGGNCSHVIDKSISYMYPCLPVGLSGKNGGFGA